MKELRAIFAGGGTGGHLFPAIAIANQLKNRVEPETRTDFLFIGTKRGLEYRMRERLGYPLETINVRGLQRSLTLTNLLFPIVLIGSIIKSIMILSRFRPDIVIGTGGYVMAPVILAAVLLGKKRVIQEQNSFPGLATRKLARMVHKLFLGFGSAERYFKNKHNLVETGNPVKEIIGKVNKQEGIDFFGLDSNKKTVLIIGGSLGASKINENIKNGLKKLPENYQLIWQTGERDYKEVAACAGDKVSGRALFPFLNRMELAYSAADLVVARAGALTLAEIAICNLPAILIPYPYATGDHQLKNALDFSKNGAAIVIENKQLDSTDLLGKAVEMYESGQIDKMSKVALSNSGNSKKSAVDKIINEILELVKYKKGEPIAEQRGNSNQV
ncbi:MAG: undecaprenyldiphospho-muramoylpentapeptide beta-N-acetylglucosaminyltransferase [candidate division Zixibacteria bacterium]|nr:undecaprenyldiphospho-muramoylpentapeptide beta-N-acetylglucosaminyltransferase [candidate division Zixibacteria bacterium]